MMAKSAPDAVILKGDPIYKEYPLEAIDACGAGAITPGMLCETVGGDIRPHSTRLGYAQAIFGVEGLNLDPDSLTMGDIDDPYDNDAQNVKVAYSRRGDEIYALLAVGQNATIDALLASHGDGTFEVSATNAVVRAKEAVNNSAGTTWARIRVEVL